MNLENNFIQKKVSVKQIRDFVIVISLVMLFCVFYFDNYYLLIIPVFLISLFLLKSKLLEFLTVVWFTISNVLGYISSVIILTLLFIFFVIPIGTIRKLFGKDSLQNADDRNSSFKFRNHIFTNEDYLKPF